MVRHNFSKAIQVYHQTLDKMKLLTSFLSNGYVMKHYHHSGHLKRHDAAMMALIVYVDLTYCYQMVGEIEQMLYSTYEAEEVVSTYLFDSIEARNMVSMMKDHFLTGVGLIH